MLARTIAAFLVTTTLVSGQGNNCQLLGTHNVRSNYNDVWGYVAPNGKEYALLMNETGTAILDCSNPATPVERGYIPGATSVWRDARTWSSYAYVVTEGAGGFQVIDLSNPDQPFLARTVGAQQFGNAHNICVDLGTGRIYVLGTNNGTPVFDAAANPADPPFVGNALPRGGNANATYFHDLCVDNGFAYGSMIYNGVLRIMDTTALPLPVRSNASTPGTFTHNAWVNAAGTLAVTTDEVSGGLVKFFDVTNKSAPVPRGQFTPNAASTPHNAYILGNHCHVSWYTEGYRCLDVRDPANPVEVASYDTWPGASGGYSGAWGVFPFLPSGNVFVSDRATGLYIVKPGLTDLAIAHTALADTPDETGPYAVTAVITTSNTFVGADLVWSVDGGIETTVAMAATANPAEYAASIPGQRAPARVAYRLVARDNVAAVARPSLGAHEFLVGVAVRLFEDDFEIERGWTHGAIAGNDDWQRTTPLGNAGSSGGIAWADPLGAFSAANARGNALGPVPFTGAYANGTNNWLQSPLIATGGAQGLHLRYRRWLSLHTGDVGNVLVNGQTIASVPPQTRDAGWQWIDHDISAVTDTVASFSVRFELVADATNVAGGWTLDDFEIYYASDCSPPVRYGAGTAGTGGIVPTIALLGAPRLGQVAIVDAGGLLGAAPTILVLGVQPTALPVLGIQALVDPQGAFSLFGIATGAAGQPGAGFFSLPLAVPSNPRFDDFDLFAQVAVFDLGAPGGLLAASEGLRFRICRL